MGATPELILKAKSGPSLDLAKHKSPVLTLQSSVAAPVLSMPLQMSTLKADLSHAIPALVFVCLGSLVAIVTVPLSQGSQWARIPVEQLMADATVLMPPWSEPAVDTDAVPTAEAMEESVQATQTEAATPFELLVGVNCSEYLPGEEVSVSAAAFDEHIWRKLPAELQAQAQERLEVCGPFEPIHADVIVSQGCVENGCGVNDVRFFLSADNKAAVEILTDGQCTPSSEPGFRHKNLLCMQR